MFFASCEQAQGMTDKKDFFFGALIFIKALPPKKVAWLDRFRCCAIGERPVYVFHLRNWRHIRFRIGSQMT